VLAVVGARTITVADLQDLVKAKTAVPASTRTAFFLGPEKTKELLDEMVRFEVLAQEAETPRHTTGIRRCPAPGAADDREDDGKGTSSKRSADDVSGHRRTKYYGQRERIQSSRRQIRVSRVVTHATEARARQVSTAKKGAKGRAADGRALPISSRSARWSQPTRTRNPRRRAGVAILGSFSRDRPHLHRAHRRGGFAQKDVRRHSGAHRRRRHLVVLSTQRVRLAIRPDRRCARRDPTERLFRETRARPGRGRARFCSRRRA